MPTESLQINASKDYIKRLQFIEALKDEEDEDWSFVPEKILQHQIRKTPRWVYKKIENGKVILASTTKKTSENQSLMER